MLVQIGNAPCQSRRTRHPAAPARLWALPLALAALLAASAKAAEDVPHRRLATIRFPGPEELNNPLSAIFPELEQLNRVAQLSKLLNEEAQRQGIDLATASPEFFQEQVESLLAREPDLVAALPDLARVAQNASPTTVEAESIQRLADALETSPFRESVERFLVSSALRAQTDRTGKAFRQKLRELGRFFENAGVSQSHVDRLREFYRRADGSVRNFLGNLRELTGRAAERAGALKMPPFLVPSALAIVGALGIIFFLRKKNHASIAPPALPDFRALAPRGGDFVEALLAFYRRILHDAGLPFRGKVLAELARDAASRRPDIAGDLPPLNRAFYEIWYGKAEKPRGELEMLTALLADLATRARLMRGG